MTKYTPPNKYGKAKGEKNEDKRNEIEDEEQDEVEENDDKEERRRKLKSGSLDSVVLTYLVKKGFVNDIKVTMTFDELVECIESVSE